MAVIRFTIGSAASSYRYCRSRSFCSRNSSSLVSTGLPVVLCRQIFAVCGQSQPAIRLRLASSKDKGLHCQKESRLFDSPQAVQTAFKPEPRSIRQGAVELSGIARQFGLGSNSCNALTWSLSSCSAIAKCRLLWSGLLAMFSTTCQCRGADESGLAMWEGSLRPG